MQRSFPRRRFFAVGAGVVAAVGSSPSLDRAGASGASATPVTLWKLDPAWGHLLTTSSGRTRARCRGRACHAAAPHRFFLTSADAVAGRLHPCCLAQPVPVQVCVWLNELQPYFAARLGGVDTRCPALPSVLRAALLDGACTAGSSPGVVEGVSPATPTSAPPSAAAAAAGAEAVEPNGGLDTPAARPAAENRSLAFTGSDSSTAVAVAGGAIAAGALAVALSRRSED